MGGKHLAGARDGRGPRAAHHGQGGSALKETSAAGEKIDERDADFRERDEREALAAAREWTFDPFDPWLSQPACSRSSG